MPRGLRIAVVGTDSLARKALVEQLGREPDMTVVAQGRTSADALAAARFHGPDLVIMDSDLEGGSASATRFIAGMEGNAAPHVVILSSSEDEDTVCMALAAGARAFLPRACCAEELVPVIRAVQAGETYVSPHLAGRLLLGRAMRNGVLRQGEAAAAMSREERVMRLVSRGFSNSEIAGQLDMPEVTVASCVDRVLARIAARQGEAEAMSRAQVSPSFAETIG